MSITVAIKTVYGKEVIKPADQAAEIFCKLLKQSSLTHADIQYIKALGYTVNVQQTQPNTL